MQINYNAPIVSLSIVVDPIVMSLYCDNPTSGPSALAHLFSKHSL